MPRQLRLCTTGFGLVLMGAVLLPVGGRIGSSSAASKPLGGKISARLAATKLAPIQASEIKLDYRFSRPSAGFSYQLQRKRGGKWIELRSARHKGHLKGKHSTTVKRIFGKRAIRAGNYRLRLHSDRNLVSLRFSVFAARSIKDAKGVSAGGMQTCILVRGGGVKCWGNNLEGELGDSTRTSSSTPVPVGGVTGAIAVNSGYKHSCVVYPGGTISCWGTNFQGELGNGTLANSSTPLSVPGLSGVVASSSGMGHTCALLADGSLYCWGDNEVGELGVGSVNRVKPYGFSSPVRVDAVSNAIAVSAGFLNTCVLISGGSIECWGYNTDGQVGNGTVSPKRPHAVPAPVQVSGITNAVEISAGAFHTCALISGGSVECWGYITASDFNPTPLLNSAYPRQAVGIENAVSISSGGFHTCALIADGTVKCWGADSFGQLGDGNWLDSVKPVTVLGIKHAVSISSGALHTCAVLAGGAVKCWGGNDEGELGTGTITASSVPLSVVQPTR